MKLIDLSSQIFWVHHIVWKDAFLISTCFFIKCFWFQKKKSSLDQIIMMRLMDYNLFKKGTKQEVKDDLEWPCFWDSVLITDWRWKFTADAE